MGVVIGIDLGTSYSAAAAVRDDSVVLVEDAAGRRTVPSVVHFGPSGEVTVGYEARARVADDAENTVHASKRLLGRRFDDGAVRVARNAYLYRVVEGPNGWPLIEARGGPFAVPEICACILKELRSRAEAFFGEPVTGAVVTVPANADDAQREQTRIAARIAGLEVLRLLNEPTAAALAHSLAGEAARTAVVYDFGGGTFDCSVVELGASECTVLATHGDDFLGGDDVDLALAMHVARRFQQETGADLRGRIAEWRQLLVLCEEAKLRLATEPTTEVVLAAAAHLPGGVTDLRCAVDRTTLDRLAGPFVQQTVELMTEAVSMAGLGWDLVDDLLLVGGSSRLPSVRAAVARATGKAPAASSPDPDTAVCVGAALEACRLSGGGARLPSAVPRRLVDVVPHSIGLATAGGGFDRVIERNSPLPASGRRAYTSWRDGQAEMRFVVLQGDAERAEGCAFLGEFVVDGLPPRPSGRVEVELVLEVGGDGLLRATARETTTGALHSYRVRIRHDAAAG